MELLADRSRSLLLACAAATLLALAAVLVPHASWAATAELMFAAALAIAALIAASWNRLVWATSLAAVAAVVAATIQPIGASIGVLAIVPLLLAVAYSVSELDRVRASQAAGQDAFDALMRFLPVGVFRTTLAGRVNYVNPTVRSLTGLTSESIGDWRELLASVDRDRIDAAWQRFQRGTTPFDESFWVHTSAGRRWLSVRISPEYAQGDLVGYIGTMATSPRSAAPKRRATDPTPNGAPSSTTRSMPSRRSTSTVSCCRSIAPPPGCSATHPRR